MASGARAYALLKRIDGGRCRASTTFVSERYYGPADTTNGNIGDSWCAMGRIAWFDALTRKRLGEADSFTHILLHPLQVCLCWTEWYHMADAVMLAQKQVLASTWMHERQLCNGRLALCVCCSKTKALLFDVFSRFLWPYAHIVLRIIPHS